jgi:very-short-patch-repair endonuclease
MDKSVPMTYYSKPSICCHCNESISPRVYSFSMENFELPLCIPCQEEFKIKSQKATPIAVALYKQLKKRGVPAELEKWDGTKTIDIAVVDAKVNIEVDGSQHNFNADQAMRDLLRTLLAFKKGYLTLRIPNSLVKYNLEKTADLITEFLIESKEQFEYD